MKSVIIGVIVAAVAVGGYFVYQDMNKPKTAGEKLDSAIEQLGQEAERIGGEIEDATENSGGY